MATFQTIYNQSHLRINASRRWRVVCLFISILVTINAKGQFESESIIKIDLPTSVEPGKLFTVFVDIRKTKTIDSLSSIVINLPQRWRLLTSKKSIKNDSLIRCIYGISIPSDAEASEYQLSIKLNLNGITITKSVKLLVRRIRDIQVVAFDTPEFVKEGDSLKIDFLINNSGNAEEKLFLKSIYGKIEKISDTLLLKKKESILVSVRQKIPKGTESAWYITSDLVVYLKDSLLPITTLVSTSVYGAENKQQDQYLRFPTEISSIYVGTSSENNQFKALQYDFKGKGFLDFTNKHFAEFTIHGPDQFSIPITGSYEILALKYSYLKKSVLQLGDYQLKLSNLIEFGRFCRGFRYDYDFQKIGISFFYAKPRFFSEIAYEYGVNFRYNHSDKFQMGFDLIKKASQNVLPYSVISNLYSITSKYRTKGWDVETEFAVSQSFDKNHLAVFNNMNISLGKFYLSSSFIYASKDFQGFYRNSLLSVNNINYRFSDKLSVGITHNFTRINPSFDLLMYNTSPYINNFMLVSNYQISEKNQLRFSYNWQEREDRMIPQNFHYKEDFANIIYSYLSKKLNILYSGRFGRAQNLLVFNDENLLRQSFSNSLNPEVKIVSSTWLGGILEHQQTSKYSINNAIANYFFYGGTLKVKLKHWLNASLMYRNNFTPDVLIVAQSFVNGLINVNIGEQHLISASFGRTFVPYHQNIAMSNHNMFYFSVKYTLKLNLPIARSKKNGAVYGKVESTDLDLKLSDLLIKIGEKRTLTDHNGNFYFNDLLPSRYLLKIENTSLPKGVTNIRKSPIEVIVKQDSVHRVKLSLVKTSQVLGKINLLTTNYQKDSINKIPLIFVTFEKGLETFTTKVNEKGEFCYKEILPGEWKVKAWFANRQELFSFENSEQIIQVIPNKESQLSFTVISKERKLHFSDKTFQLHVKLK